MRSVIKAFSLFLLIIGYPALMFCTIIIGARVIMPFIVENFPSILVYPLMIFWFFCTWIVPLNVHWVEKFMGSYWAIRYPDIQNVVFLVWSILLFIV